MITLGVFVLGYLYCLTQFPGFASTRVICNILTDNAFLGIIAVGMTFVILSGGIDLSVGSVIAFSAYFTLIARIGTQKTVYIGVVTPVISVLLSVQFEHYRPAAIEWVGMLLCLSSVAWALTSGARKTAAVASLSTTPSTKAT